MKYSEKYRVLAVDGVVFLKDKVILLKRNHSPFEGYWVLPGGLVEQGETVKEAVKREIYEEIGIKVEINEFIDLYDDPGRDKRGNISASYICKKKEGKPTARQEAYEVNTFSINSLPELGFDHKKIIKDAASIHL